MSPYQRVYTTYSLTHHTIVPAGQASLSQNDRSVDVLFMAQPLYCITPSIPLNVYSHAA